MTSRPFSAVTDRQIYKNGSHMERSKKRPFSAEPILRKEEILNYNKLDALPNDGTILNLPSTQILQSLLSETVSSSWTTETKSSNKLTTNSIPVASKSLHEIPKRNSTISLDPEILGFKNSEILTTTKSPRGSNSYPTTSIHLQEILGRNLSMDFSKTLRLKDSETLSKVSDSCSTTSRSLQEIPEHNSLINSPKIRECKDLGILISGIKTKPPLPENTKKRFDLIQNMDSVREEAEDVFQLRSNDDVNEQSNIGFLTDYCFLEDLEESNFPENDNEDVANQENNELMSEAEELEKQTDKQLENLQKHREDLSGTMFDIKELLGKNETKNEDYSKKQSQCLKVDQKSKKSQKEPGLLKKQLKSSLKVGTKQKKTVTYENFKNETERKLQEENETKDLKSADIESWIATNNHENFLDFLNKLDDLDIPNDNDFKPDLYLQSEPEHDTDKEQNTYNDIASILEVLEKEDLKSQQNIEAMKIIVNNEIQDLTDTKSQTPIEIIQDIKTNQQEEKKNFKQFDIDTLVSSSNYNDFLNYLETIDQNCIKTLNRAKERLQDVTKVTAININIDVLPKFEDLINYTNVELSHNVVDLSLRLKEKSASVSVLQTELTKLRNTLRIKIEEFEKLTKEKLKLQKDDYEAVIKRHQKFIDQLIADKKTLNTQCDGLISEMKVLEDRYNTNMKAVEQRHKIELQKAKDMHMAAEKVRREKWMEGKTQKIKEMTVKSLEPELQSMTNRHQQELSDLRSLHKRELEDLELRAARKTQQQCEALRQQLTVERETAITHERDILRQRLEKLVESEEKSYQEQRRRLNAEHASRLAECEERLNQMANEKERAIEAIKTEHDDKLQTALRRHKTELKNQKETVDLEFEVWKNNYKKQQSIKLTEIEGQIKELCKRERDREIETVIERLEQEACEMKEQMEQAAENRLRRLKEKYEQEIKDLEKSATEYKNKYSDTKEKLLSHEDVIINLNTSMKQLQAQLQNAKQISDGFTMDKNQMREQVREEFQSEIVALETEIKMLKASKEEDLQQIFMKVKLTVARKDELLSELTKNNTNLQEKCKLLENLLEQQRQEYLIK